MKKIQKFFSEKPSYVKCGVEKVSEAAGVAVSTIIKFRKTDLYKEIKNNYLNK